jgi:hypothetical protein
MAVLPTATGVLAESAGGTGTTTGYYGFKNRIINGAMVIDQRNAGASVATSASNQVYSLDRWFGLYAQTSKFTMQQNAGSVTPPAGFTNYLGITSTSAYSSVSTDYMCIGQRIEGFNTADLSWGTASAKTVTLSFQVYSSLTGTFGGSIRNGVGNRSYPFTYSIPTANTWTSISVTIAGDTSGAWTTNNSTSIEIDFNVGSGTTFSGTAGSWSANNYTSATGAVSVVGTNGATFYITGVQLEKGATATSFDYRPFGTEFSLCQRYFETSYDYGQALGATPTNITYTRWSTNGTANALEKWFRVSKRATPTVNTYDTVGNVGKIRIFDGITDANNITPTAILGTFNSMFITYNVTANGMQFVYTASAEL